MSILSDIVAKLESGGGLFNYLQPRTMVDPTFGQYRGFVNQYGGGAAGVDNYAQQVLAANPNATLGDFYSSYVLGTGNPGALHSPASLQANYPTAYNNLVNNSGYSLNTPLSQLVGGGAAGAAGGVATSIGDAMNTAASGISNMFGGGSSGGSQQSAGGLNGIFKGVEDWITNATGSVVFVIVGMLLLFGALIIFAANEAEKHPEFMEAAAAAAG